MKIECVQLKLTEAISRAEKVAGKNLQLAVLSCLLLEAKDGNLTIRSTNLDIGIEITFPVKVIEEGKVAIPANVISGALSGMSSDKNIEIMVVEGGNVKITTSLNSIIIKTLPSEDFPSIPVVSPESEWMMSGQDFARGLKAVWYSSSISSIKPELSSIYTYCDAGYVIFAATDSFRLGEKKVKVKKDKDFTQILIPHKNVSEIIRFLESIQGEVRVQLSKNQVSLSAEGTYLVSRVIDGVFPDYKQIIPKNFTTEVIVLKQDLVSALRVSNLFSDKFNQLNMRILPKEGVLEFKTKNSDVGESVYRLAATLSGEPLEINFNYKYITDCFQSIEGDSVSFSFNGLNRPLIMKSVSDQSFMYLVMPMNR